MFRAGMRTSGREKSLLPRLAPILGFVLAASLMSCGGRKETSSGPGDEPPATHAPGKPVDPATSGSVTGIVKFDGTPPNRRPISMAAAQNCAKLHSSPVTAEDFVPGANGTLQNVVVYLKGDFSQYDFPRATAPVKVDQNGCTYVPHTVALMTGEPLQVSNSDPVTHNVNVVSERRQGWNESQGPGASPFERTFAREEIAIPVKCNVHTWMKFYIAVVSHPYFQVTAQDGAFNLKNVPAGTYTLAAWHELYGTKEQTITVAAQQQESAAITFTDRDHR
jgi:hypothetical protein